MNIRQVTEIVKESTNVSQLYEKLTALLKEEKGQIERAAYLSGAADALGEVSFWKEGTLYVGNPPIKLKDVIEKLKNTFDKI